MNNYHFINYYHVNSVKFLEKQKRVIFNFDYSIKIKNKRNHIIITDYIYNDFDNADEYNEYKARIIEELSHRSFFETYSDSKYTEYVNVYKIANIKVDEKNPKKVIINLASTISYVNDKNDELLTSDFLAYTFDTPQKAENFIEDLFGFLEFCDLA